MSKQLALLPHLSEQTYAQAQASRVYVFAVPKNANKHTVARAVAIQFGVAVHSVNMTNVKGKVKRTTSLGSSRRRANSEGSRSDVKKAYVKLAEGFKLPVFAAVEEAEAEQKVAQEKADKAAAKQKRGEK